MAPDLIILDAKSKATRIIIPNDVVILLGAGFVALPELAAAVMHKVQLAQQPAHCCEC